MPDLPQHIAIIMDGNGRWATQKGMPREYGHKHGAESLRKTIRACASLGIPYLTVYVFSTENWKRPKSEVRFLMSLLSTLIKIEVAEMKKQGVRVRFLGRMDGLPEKTQSSLRKAVADTAHNTKVTVNLMVNYGGRAEIIDAAMRFAAEVKAGRYESNQLTEDLFSEFLYTHDMPDPDILIRTGGDHRISNYLLWQIAYSELFVIDTLWPDFDQSRLEEIIHMFRNRERRFGGIQG